MFTNLMYADIHVSVKVYVKEEMNMLVRHD